MFFSDGKKQFLTGWRSVNSFYVHLRRGTRWLVNSVVIVAVLLLAFVMQGWWSKNDVKADSASFYPAKCLGGWQYTAHAENVPELDVSAGVDDFNDINSAVLDNAMAQLYCSNFNGDDPIGTVPTKVSLRLSLAVKEAVVVEVPTDSGASEAIGEVEVGSDESEAGQESQGPEEVPQTETEDEGSVLDSPEPVSQEVVPDSESAPVLPSVEPSPGSESVSEPVLVVPELEPGPSSEPTSFLNSWLVKLVIKPVWAEETQLESEKVQVSEAQPSQENSDSPDDVMPPDSQPSAESEIEKDKPEESASPESLPQPVDESMDGVSSSEDLIVEESVESVAESAAMTTMPSDALLELSYTLNGQDWLNLGWVREGDWRNVSFDLPLTEIDDWSNLDWLQVRIDRVASLNDNQPVFYLDGMTLVVEYDELSAEDDKEVIDGIDQPNLKKDKLIKQRALEQVIVIDVERRGSERREIWYKKRNPAGQYWQKIDLSIVSDPMLLDFRSNLIFLVNNDQDGRRSLVAYNVLTGSSNRNAVIPGALSSLSFDEPSEDGSGLLTAKTLYFLDEGDVYYFSEAQNN